MILRTKLILAFALLGWGFILFYACDKRKDQGTASINLPPGVVEKIVINPSSHTLTIVKPTGQDRLFLPDRPSSIEVDKSGKVTLTSRQFGTELKPFGGLGFGESLRLYGGLDLGYWKRVDGGVFGSINKDIAARIGIDVSYIIYDNCRLSLGVDNTHSVNLFISVRL